MTPPLPVVPLQANRSPEFWSFVLTNVLSLSLGSTLTVIAFVAYRREDHSAFLLVSAGFGFLTLGTLVEILYELSAKEVHVTGLTAFGRELFLLRTVEGILIVAGLALLILSFKRA